MSQLQQIHEEKKEFQQNLPFLIEPYSKQDRQKQRQSRPKLGLRRLTQDKKLVSIDIDIPIDENTIIKQKFDWDLAKDKISPTEFSIELVNALNLPKQYAQKMKEQILSQIMQHIKHHTKQKLPEQRQNLDDQMLYNRGYQLIRFNNQYPEEDLEKQENEKKKMSRMRKERMRTTTVNNVMPNRYFKEKKICRNCRNQNITPGFQCKNCKIPFELLQVLNLDDKRVKISAKYYEKIANKIPLLTYEAKKRHFQKEDFDSFYGIYNKIKTVFETCEEFTKEHLNQVRYIMQKYHEYFLNGQIDFNDQDIIYEKDIKKDGKEEDSRPKRQRGRPRKVKIMNEDLIISGDNDSNSSDNSNSDDDYDSDDSS